MSVEVLCDYCAIIARYKPRIRVPRHMREPDGRHRECGQGMSRVFPEVLPCRIKGNGAMHVRLRRVGASKEVSWQDSFRGYANRLLVQ